MAQKCGPMPCRYRNEATLRRASGEVLPLYAGANAPHDLYVLKDGKKDWVGSGRSKGPDGKTLVNWGEAPRKTPTKTTAKRRERHHPQCVRPAHRLRACAPPPRQRGRSVLRCPPRIRHGASGAAAEETQRTADHALRVRRRAAQRRLGRRGEWAVDFRVCADVVVRSLQDRGATADAAAAGAVAVALPPPHAGVVDERDTSLPQRRRRREGRYGRGARAMR